VKPSLAVTPTGNGLSPLKEEKLYADVAENVLRPVATRTTERYRVKVAFQIPI
jgi:hypothetical protein